MSPLANFIGFQIGLPGLLQRCGVGLQLGHLSLNAALYRDGAPY